ncbi:acyl-CoA carboxylase subunit epsilon [Streptomyces sp. JNUCC 63]
MIKVVRGNPTPEELAAALAVIQARRAAAARTATGSAPRRTGVWASPHLLLRTPHTYGPAGWLAPSLPQ